MVITHGLLLAGFKPAGSWLPTPIFNNCCIMHVPLLRERGLPWLLLLCDSDPEVCKLSSSPELDWHSSELSSSSELDDSSENWLLINKVAFYRSKKNVTFIKTWLKDLLLLLTPLQIHSHLWQTISTINTAEHHSLMVRQPHTPTDI